MRIALAFLLLAAACDPDLNLSSPRVASETVEGCPEAMAHFKECCPKYESFVSCSVYENAAPDLTTRQSRCVRGKDCAMIERSVTSGTDLCGVSFRGHHCR